MAGNRHRDKERRSNALRISEAVNDAIEPIEAHRARYKRCLIASFNFMPFG
jgi:hypothetical protein